MHHCGSLHCTSMQLFIITIIKMSFLVDSVTPVVTGGNVKCVHYNSCSSIQKSHHQNESEDILSSRSVNMNLVVLQVELF